MVTTLVILIAGWIVAALGAGLGVGRVISRADLTHEMSELVREAREATAR